MKKYSQTRMSVEYILIAFLAYLIVSLGISIIGQHNYRVVLSHPSQVFGLFLIYWWIPIFRIADMLDHNESLKN